MPKIKQPLKLEHLAIKASVIWLCNVGQKMMPTVTKITKRHAQKASEILKDRILILRNIFEYNVPCYLYDRISEEIFISVPNLIDNIKKNLSLNSSMSEFLSQVNVAVSLAEVLMSPFLKRLNFDEMPKMMRQLFYTKLKEFRGLQYLNLSSLSGGWKTSDMEPTILNGIIDMKNLHTLILNYDCTDNILIALEKVCPRLHTLDISSSKMITNNSVKYLIELTHLKNLQLYRTSITIEGYIRLLIKLPQLEDIGRYDDIGRCLEYIDMTYENFDDRPKLNLRIFHSRNVITKHIQLLSEFCPEIRSILLFHNPLLNDLMALISINKLTILKLLSCDFFGDQVRDVLQVKGCNLTHLQLEHVDQIDMNALMYISQYCPDLKIFTLYNCELIDSTSLYTYKLDIPPFMNLERLMIAAHCSLQHMEFLLSNCYKIKFIHIGTMAPTNDELFNRVLLKNPMQYLEELRIIYSDSLTIKTAYKIVDICQNLCIFNELESWTRVKELELEMFKLYISTRNYDLDIKPLRKFNQVVGEPEHE